MSDADSSSVPPSGPSSAKDRHEPRGRKPNDQLPPSRAREVQRAFRLRRAEHLASLEERIALLENENTQLRALLNLPEADRPKIGSGPTGRGKSLIEGGVPMSERVRARKEARERERRAKGLPDLETSEDDDNDSMTVSPRAISSSGPGTSTQQHHQQQQHNHHPSNTLPPIFNHPTDTPAPFNYQLPIPFNLPVSPEPNFPDFSVGSSSNMDPLFKGSTPGFSGMFNMFDTPQPTDRSSSVDGHGNSSQQQGGAGGQQRRSPISPPLTNPGSSPNQPDLLTRLKACCHLSDSHVVNDPGLLIFATRLCQSFPCQFGGVHPDLSPPPTSDADHLLLEDSWRALKAQLDPGGEADGENRINTGRMAAELIIRAAHSRGSGAWILCRYREGMSIKKSLVGGLVQGFGGKFE